MLGGAGPVQIPDRLYVFFIYGYFHIFKDLFISLTKRLRFLSVGKELLGCWSSIVNLFEENMKKPICLIILTFRLVHPKRLKPQILLLLYQVFNAKTVAAYKTLHYTFVKTF